MTSAKLPPHASPACGPWLRVSEWQRTKVHCRSALDQDLAFSKASVTASETSRNRFRPQARVVASRLTCELPYGEVDRQHRRSPAWATSARTCDAPANAS